MANYITRSLMGKTVASFLAVALVPILIVGYVSYHSAGTALEKAEFDKLTGERDLRKKELLRYFGDIVQNLIFLADTKSVRDDAETLITYNEYGKTAADAPFDTNSVLYNKIYERLNPFFQSFLKTHPPDVSGYRDILILSAEDGNIMYTAEKKEDLGASLQRGALKGSGLAGLWAKVVKTGAAAVSDLEDYPPAKGPAAFVGVPVAWEGKPVNGVLVMRLGMEQITAIFASTQAAGRTIQSYLVGSDFLMRSDSRFEKEPTVLRKKVETFPVREALNDRSGTIIGTDYRGASVLSAYSPVGLKGDKNLAAGFEWALVTDVETDEAFEPVYALRSRVILIALFIASVVILLAFVSARNFAGPVIELAGRARRISEGDLTVELAKSSRADELGALQNAFDSMVNNLREQNRQVMEGVEVLASSSRKIAATISQVVTSASETSTAVGQTTTTVEQVKQAAGIASERAKHVATRSHEAVQTSESGKTATDDTLHMMHIIKERIESVGETVVKLSQDTQAIENVMSAVQDLAAQSNLLAVNASIEAARAGEQGKGFAVVAQEIKSLADQSRQSTFQVRKILDDIRNSVSGVVMATEQGVKAVDGGVHQSSVARESIQQLAASVDDSAQAATVILASSEQQFTGVDQVASAMGNIEVAMRQTLTSANQLGSEASRLEELGEELKSLVERYKL